MFFYLRGRTDISCKHMLMLWGLWSYSPENCISQDILSPSLVRSTNDFSCSCIYHVDSPCWHQHWGRKTGRVCVCSSCSKGGQLSWTVLMTSREENRWVPFTSSCHRFIICLPYFNLFYVFCTVCLYHIWTVTLSQASTVLGRPKSLGWFIFRITAILWYTTLAVSAVSPTSHKCIWVSPK